MNLEQGSAENQTTIPFHNGRLHSLCGTSLGNWGRLLIDHGGVDRACLGRAMAISLLAPLASIGWMATRAVEAKARHGASLRAPLFIVGHWRSGTSFLHELLACDPQLATPTLWEGVVPPAFWHWQSLKRIYARRLPRYRPMDAMPLDLETPQEDEFAMALRSRWSYIHCLHFPRGAPYQFERGVLFNGLSAREQDRWERDYLDLLRSLQREKGDRRLLLKNPANTARIPTLLRLFPDARFIHLHRNPYTVLPSMVRMMERTIGLIGLQGVNRAELVDQALRQYAPVVTRGMEGRERVPNGQWVDVAFEALESDPLNEARRIYNILGLPGWGTALPELRRYLDRRRDYRKNHYEPDPEALDQIEAHCGFAARYWGYRRPSAVAPVNRAGYGDDDSSAQPG